MEENQEQEQQQKQRSEHNRKARATKKRAFVPEKNNTVETAMYAVRLDKT